MRANIFLLYGSTVMIWGTTWLAIKFQLGSVDPMVSVLYRFVAAAMILIFYCKLLGLRMRFQLKDHVFMNMINGALLMGSPIRLSVVVGGGVGIVGIVFVFWPEISAFSLSDKAAIGVLLAAVSTFMASLGNIISARHQKYDLPVIQTNAYGMAYGAVIMGIIAIASGRRFGFEMTFPYVSSLSFLSLFGTVIAFGSYLKLIGKIGADRAAYATMLFSIVALAISTVYEGYQWSAHNIIGMVLVLIGNALVLNKKALLK